MENKKAASFVNKKLMNAANYADLSRLVVCVDACSPFCMSGRVYSCYTQRTMHFSCFEALMLSCEAFLEAIDFPQAAFEKRSFCTKNSQKLRKSQGTAKFQQNRGTYLMQKNQADEPMVEKGDKCTFVVQVMCRQNASWQGSVRWVEGAKTQNFRSMLELSYLMNDAMDSAMNAVINTGTNGAINKSSDATEASAKPNGWESLI